MSNEVHSPWDALDTIGNIAAWVRENCGDATNQTQKYMDDIIMFVNAALALPRRNCDVGTAEEQAARMDKFCDSHGHGFDGHGTYACENCKFISVDRCELAWAQMPYEAREGGAE